jgi:hypothetical protein
MLDVRAHDAIRARGHTPICLSPYAVPVGLRVFWTPVDRFLIFPKCEIFDFANSS